MYWKQSLKIIEKKVFFTPGSLFFSCDIHHTIVVWVELFLNRKSNVNLNQSKAIYTYDHISFSCIFI